MKIENQFTVGVPVERAWNVMLDLERIAPCLPGASIQEQQEDGTYKGTMKVKIGPITANYRGTVSYKERDDSGHRAVLEATGRDARGQGTASATITATLEEADGGTRVNVETDMRLTGRAAQFGRGVAQDVASKIFEQFADCLEREIAGGEETSESEADGGSGASSSGGAGSTPASGEAAGAPVAGFSTLGNVVSEDPMVTAGSSLGAITVGSVVSEHSEQAAREEKAGEQQRSTTRETPRREPPEEPEPLDLGAASREALMKRLVPVAAGIGAIALIVLILRARR
ncbi:SRPBCC family protein [Rubrobacter calidifluminis]|uniref:SRPBCC family protein n=1 Tax=Rubrobacter calidifluminis TaxID=1392640 RepID=UPI0023606D2C|nr:SRPBCC family protein [Rubrobacter calidifluminis]